MGQVLDHVEQDHIAKLLEPRQMGQRSADVPRADQRDLVPRHGNPFRCGFFIIGHRLRARLENRRRCQPIMLRYLTQIVNEGKYGYP